jgi:ATP synthase F1 gamma subunit
VLKNIAASQFRQLEKKKERFVTFADAFEGFFHMIDFSSVKHPFAQGEGKLAIIIITSDEGFMGGLNTRVINMALDYPGAEAAELIVIGGRGAAYLKGMGLNFVEFPGIGSEGGYEAALSLRNFIMKEGLAGRFSRLMLFYPRPLSFTVQKVEALSILPCSELFKKREKVVFGEGIILESSLDNIIEYLVATWITEKLFEVFEDSKLSEFAARTVHLEESHQVLLQRDKAIRFQYFRSHHELVDRGMRQTFSAQVIRKKK